MQNEDKKTIFLLITSCSIICFTVQQESLANKEEWKESFSSC